MQNLNVLPSTQSELTNPGKSMTVTSEILCKQRLLTGLQDLAYRETLMAVIGPSD